MLRNADVIDDEEVRSDIISIGCTVTLLDLEFEEEMEYSIVGSAEADPLKGKISNESPVGMALLGHKIGQEVSIEVPSGVVTYKVLKISK